jgi:hypothetical protein
MDVDDVGRPSDVGPDKQRDSKRQKQLPDVDVSGNSSALEDGTAITTMVLWSDVDGIEIDRGVSAVKVIAPWGDNGATSVYVMEKVTASTIKTPTLHVTATFTLQRDENYLYLPDKDQLLSGLEIAPTTWTISFVGRLKSNRRNFYRWPLSAKHGPENVLEKIANALRQQLAMWQSQRTTAVRTHHQGALPRSVLFSPLRAALQAEIGSWFGSLVGRGDQAAKDAASEARRELLRRMQDAP